MKNLIALLKQDAGTSVIELGIVAPILAGLVAGTADLSLAWSQKLNYEQAAQTAIERVMQDAWKSSLETAMKDEAANLAGVTANDVTVTWWLECNGTKQTNYGTTCPTGQTYARYLKVQIDGTYDPLFPLLTFGTNDKGLYDVSGSAGIRTQ